MGKQPKRAQSALRYNKDTEVTAAEVVRKPIRVAPAMSDEHLRDTFIPYVSARVAADYQTLLRTQRSVQLQRIWSRVCEGARTPEVVQPIFSSFVEQTPLSDAQAKRLWKWILGGGLAERVVEIYEIALRILQGSGLAVPSHRGGPEDTKRGRVTARR